MHPHFSSLASVQITKTSTIISWHAQELQIEELRAELERNVQLGRDREARLARPRVDAPAPGPTGNSDAYTRLEALVPGAQSQPGASGGGPLPPHATAHAQEQQQQQRCEVHGRVIRTPLSY